MENRCQVALLTLGDGAGTVFARWQSAWIDRTITWAGVPWDYQQMDWSGITSGQASSSQASITVPALPSVRAMLERALGGVWVAELAIYTFPDDGGSDSGPPAAMTLIGATIGEVIGGSGNLSQMTIRLGSALSPLGASFPPRTATTPLIGVPCRF